jgi:glyoxylase-like metal-dependent hydrolase (beta-lactamase superfamily II)
MKVQKISSNIYKIEAWLLIKMSAWIVTVSDGVYIVDTGMPFMGKRILKEAEKLGNVKGILLTHGHSDHVGGLKKILELKKIPVYAHEDEIKYMEGKEPFPGRKKAEFLVQPGIVQPLKMTNENIDTIESLIPIHTPGHSPGHVVYYHQEDQVLIGGDLFTSKNGQLQKPMAMFTADMKEAVKSGRVIEKLKPNLVSICHGNDVKEPYKQIQNYLATYS